MTAVVGALSLAFLMAAAVSAGVRTASARRRVDPGAERFVR